MLKILYLVNLFTFGFSTLSIDGFTDISESVPKEDIDFSTLPGFTHSLRHEGREQQVEACAEICLESGYFCNSFVVLAMEEDIECAIFPTLGSVLKTSPNKRNSVIAVYDWESLPTAHELSRRFSKSPSDKMVKYMSEKYALPEKWEEITQKILKTCSIALGKNLPETVSITDWLRTGDLTRSQIRRQSEFREELSRALELWQAWPRNPQTPLQYADTLVLTFLDIFFKSLDERITTIYDPNEKILIVEEPKKHLLIRSFGPGDYILVFAQDKGDSPLIAVGGATYGRQRSEIDHETLEMFKGAMERFGHKVSDEKLGDLHQFLFHHDSHTLSLKVVFDAATLMLSNYHDWELKISYEILFQGLVIAVVSSVLENDKTQAFRSNLHRATGISGFKPDIRDIDIITG